MLFADVNKHRLCGAGQLERAFVSWAQTVCHGAEQGLEVVAAGEGVAHGEAHHLNGLGAALPIVRRSLERVMSDHPARIEDRCDQGGRIRSHTLLNNGGCGTIPTSVIGLYEKRALCDARRQEIMMARCGEATTASDLT